MRAAPRWGYSAADARFDWFFSTTAVDISRSAQDRVDGERLQGAEARQLHPRKYPRIGPHTGY